MLDAMVRRAIDRPLLALGASLARRQVNANTVTLVGGAVGAVSCGLLIAGLHLAAMAAMLLNRALDGIDGAVARHSAPTDLGGYLDIVSDFLFYSGFIFCFAVGSPEHALAAAFLIFSFVGTGSSFLAFAIIAAKRGISSTGRGPKSFYYLGGVTEGTETILFFVAICLFPEQFTMLAYGFGLLCWLTTAGRIAIACRTFGSARHA